MICKGLMIPVALVASLVAPSARAGTPVSGPVTGVWTPSGSPYCVQGDLLVSQLVIQAGVRVEVNGPYRIEVLTTIDAQGTADQPIVFTAKVPAVRWLGMRFQNTQPGSTLRHCLIEYASDSGLQLIDSAPTIDHCTFRYNTAPAYGGGIQASLTSGDLTLTNSVIHDNLVAAYHGGGIHAVMTTGTLRLHGCRVAKNQAYSTFSDRVGGGIRISGNSEFENCVISGNRSFSYQKSTMPSGFGGGIFSDAGTALWKNCVISENVVEVRAADSSGIWTTAHGGGIYLHSGALTAINCIVAGNRLIVTKGQPASHYGGGVFVNSGSASFENCAIARNDREGLSQSSGNVAVVNSILWENYSGGSQTSGAVTIDYSCIQGGFGGFSNISFNPALSGPGYYCADMQLLPGSPCIDAGHPNSIYDDNCLTVSRGSNRNDMGAFGGPGACDWALPGDLWLTISAPAMPVRLNDTVTLTTEGGVPGNPAMVFITQAGGVPFFMPIPVLGFFCQDGRWSLSGPLTVTPGPLSMELTTWTIDDAGRLVQSNEALIRF